MAFLSRCYVETFGNGIVIPDLAMEPGNRSGGAGHRIRAAFPLPRRGRMSQGFRVA